MMSTNEDEKWSSPDMECQIEESISKDDPNSFFSLVFDSLSYNAANSASRCLSEILVWICRYNAANCFSALIEGKIGPTVDLNVPLEDGLFPLHHAAQSFSNEVTFSFLRSGAQPHVRCNCVGHKFHGLLPLNVALESLSQYVDWTPKESIFKLVLMFCQLKMNKPLRTMQKLVQRMEPKEIQGVICHYAEKGKLIELAALLTALAQARLDAFRPFTCDFEVESSGRREILSSLIATNIESLIWEEHKLMCSKSRDLANICKEKLRLMISSRLLLEIYERVGDDIIRCVGVAHCDCCSEGFLIQRMGTWAAYKIKKAGFPLTDEHLQLFKRSDWQIHLDELRDMHLAERCGYNWQKRDPDFPLLLQTGYLQKAKKKTTVRSLQQQLRSISTHSWHGKSGLFSMHQSFHLQRYKTSASSEVCTNMEVQTKKTFQVIKMQVLDLLLNKKVSTFSLLIRRAIGRP